MKPSDTGNLYNKIAFWWNGQEKHLKAGINFVQRAISLSTHKNKALDVGCGSGRISALLLDSGFNVTGIDISTSLLGYARENNPKICFIEADICEWLTQDSYDLIIAWDSIFHVPYSLQKEVIVKLCNFLTKGGVIIFSVGGVDGEITGEMQGQQFYYSSLTEINYLTILKDCGCKCILMEQDQYPEQHVVFIAAKE